ncbi:hypothetical protein BD626DRAFT_487883 [Schizophyllum amplum]|uniref:MYND-type domain-containing protein n=1 Tax=Schizophyllum amplum TaxID=97359 RepID=A0A550CK57_9AGAR|nr:hypothetical protein BD626DRAFT_487883 [Auriculariopsis ampla]
MDLLHPMNGNVLPDPVVGHHEECYDILQMVEGLMKPLLYKPAQLHDLLQTTRIVPYVVDIWVNLLRYMSRDFRKNPTMGLVTRANNAMHLLLTPGDAEELYVPRNVADAILRATGGYPRYLCRVIASYGKMLAVPTSTTFTSDVRTVPELALSACPRNAVYRLVGFLDAYITLKAWSAVQSACGYIAVLFTVMQDHRSIEWAINAGLFTALARLLDHALAPSDTLLESGAVDEVTTKLCQGLNLWSVLHAFDQMHRDHLPEKQTLRAVPYLRRVVESYEARLPALDTARSRWRRTVKYCCAYDECPTRGRLDAPGQACSGCRTAYYCSKSCQKRHWQAAHRQSCAESALHGQVESRDIFLIQRISELCIENNRTDLVTRVRHLDPNREQNLFFKVDCLQPVPRVVVLSDSLVGPGDIRHVRIVATYKDGLEKAEYNKSFVLLDAFENGDVDIMMPPE